jgi:hypothetical protein
MARDLLVKIKRGRMAKWVETGAELALRGRLKI